MTNGDPFYLNLILSFSLVYGQITSKATDNPHLPHLYFVFSAN